MTQKRTYKHSGTFGDLIYSLPIVKYFGPGEFYLHLDQINWIGSHYYNSVPRPEHQGRMNIKDYEFMKPYMEKLSYITKFDILDPKKHEITHNLDRFRTPFVHHPGNYVDIYCNTFNIPKSKFQELRNTPWLEKPTLDHSTPKYIVARTPRWLPKYKPYNWEQLRQGGVDKQSGFVGLESEYEEFKSTMGWKHIVYIPTPTLEDLARTIASTTTVISNQTMTLALAIGMGTKWMCEPRDDLPLSRNECYFPDHPNGSYMEI